MLIFFFICFLLLAGMLFDALLPFFLFLVRFVLPYFSIILLLIWMMRTLSKHRDASAPCNLFLFLFSILVFFINFNISIIEENIYFGAWTQPSVSHHLATLVPLLKAFGVPPFIRGGSSFDQGYLRIILPRTHRVSFIVKFFKVLLFNFIWHPLLISSVWYIWELIVTLSSLIHVFQIILLSIYEFSCSFWLLPYDRKVLLGLSLAVIMIVWSKVRELGRKLCLSLINSSFSRAHNITNNWMSSFFFINHVDMTLSWMSLNLKWCSIVAVFSLYHLS